MSKEDVERAGNQITGILFVGILLAVLLLVLVITFGVLGTANTQSGTTLLTTVTGEYPAWLNGTTYTLSGVNTPGFSSPTILAVTNSSKLVAPGNYTLSAAGVLVNATSTVWSNVSLNYTYTTNSNSANGLTGNLTVIQNSIIGMVINFFSLMPTIGIILAVVILIAVIVLLVLYVRRMASSGQQQTVGFQG